MSAAAFKSWGQSGIWKTFAVINCLMPHGKARYTYVCNMHVPSRAVARLKWRKSVDLWICESARLTEDVLHLGPQDRK